MSKPEGSEGAGPSAIAPFADNWAYLKTELAWLDRLLMVAVARQKRELKELDDFALSDEDRVTRHWWKGIIHLTGQPGYDHARPPKAPSGGGTYAQQLEARIVASQRRGIVLALPRLRDRLQLSMFEKNVLLLALAPEVNQRFGRLYSYLHYQHDESDWDLPTVDLCLRLLCRNDGEWRRSRPLIAPSGRLASLGLVEWVSPTDTTLLSRHLRLNEDLATYLLAEAPDPADLDAWALPPTAPASVATDLPAATWDSLVLPAAPLTQLQTLAAAARATDGTLALLAGPSGTGKTLASQVLAADLGLPLVLVDLGEMVPTLDGTLPELDDLANLPPCVLLLKRSPLWFGRAPSLDPALVQAWLIQRRRQPGLTLLSSPYPQSIRPTWRQTMGGIIEFPKPDAAAREQLWRRSLPPGLKKDRSLPWAYLGRSLPLTGGEIATLAQTAAALALQAESSTLSLDSLRQALALHHPGLALPSPRATPAKSSKNKSGQRP